MKKKKMVLGILCIITSLVITSCDVNGQTATQEGQVVAIENQAAEPGLLDSEGEYGIEVEGRIIPNQSINLSFKTSGQVAEVLVQEGEQVKAGDVIARLGDRETLEANLANAEQAHITAKLELSNANMELTNAELALLEAQNAYDELYDNLPEMLIQAEQVLTDARETERDAKRDLNYKSNPASQLDVDTAWSNFLLAKEALEAAQDEFEPYANKPKDDLGRANLQAKLSGAQKTYDRALSIYNSLSNPSSDFELIQAQSRYNIAQARLTQAQKEYDTLIEGPDPQEVTLAEARIESAKARIETAKDRITAAESNITTTEKNILAAQNAIDNLDLVAPFDGTIVDLDLSAGDQVTVGVPVVILADFSLWKVETFDLTERDVPQVYVGQEVSVILDALPDLKLSGTVEYISNLYSEKGGDITYTVHILLDESDENMRWGMTVWVTFIE